jgi:putative hydrolase of the HAD superfamily
MKFLVFDMYGVIIEESKGNFTQFVYSNFPELDRTYFRELYIKASTGSIDSDKFFSMLGFADPQASKRKYIERHLTLDKGFIPFAEKYSDKFIYALLSNDVKAWSEHIRYFHNIDKYFAHTVISADAGCRKPGREIFEFMLVKMQTTPENCIFIDNSVQNLLTARELGMDTILFNRDGEEYDGKTVNSFNELAEVV